MPISSNSDADLRVLAKLFVLLDSRQEGEATGALIRIRAITQKCGLSLYEAVETQVYKTAIWESQGKPECLHDYFDTARLREEYAKREAECDELVEAVTKLREAGKFCNPCEWKRRVIAAGLGAVVIAVWCSAFPPFEVSLKMTGLGILLGLA